MPEPTYTLIESHEALADCCRRISENSPWIGFDTEFIGEKRYVPLLCLVQVSSEVGNFLIDTIKVDDIAPLRALLEDANILKITHAGENDYQLFYRLYKTLPRNVVDVQIATGFLGDGYPSSFQKIIQKYLKIKLAKSQTVSDWKARPIRDKQIRYALNDVIYLKELWEKLKSRLNRLNRLDWVLEECSRFCEEENYAQDALGDVLSNKIMDSLKTRERLFFIRLHLWRENEAATNNFSREKVLSSKVIPAILRTIHAGKRSLASDRRIPEYIVRRHWDTLNRLYQAPITPEEEDLLARIVTPPNIAEEQNILMDMLNQVFKFICAKNKVAGTLLMPRSDFNRMKQEPNFTPDYLKKGWRRQILGEDMVVWLENRSNLTVRFSDGEIRIGME